MRNRTPKKHLARRLAAGISIPKFFSVFYTEIWNKRRQGIQLKIRKRENRKKINALLGV